MAMSKNPSTILTSSLLSSCLSSFIPRDAASTPALCQTTKHQQTQKNTMTISQMASGETRGRTSGKTRQSHAMNVSMLTASNNQPNTAKRWLENRRECRWVASRRGPQKPSIYDTVPPAYADTRFERTVRAGRTCNELCQRTGTTANTTCDSLLAMP